MSEHEGVGTVEVAEPFKIKKGAEGMCLRCGDNEGDWCIPWLGTSNIRCANCFRELVEDGEQAAA